MFGSVFCFEPGKSVTIFSFIEMRVTEQNDFWSTFQKFVSRVIFGNLVHIFTISLFNFSSKQLQNGDDILWQPRFERVFHDFYFLDAMKKQGQFFHYDIFFGLHIHCKQTLVVSLVVLNQRVHLLFLHGKWKLYLQLQILSKQRSVVLHQAEQIQLGINNF